MLALILGALLVSANSLYSQVSSNRTFVDSTRSGNYLLVEYEVPFDTLNKNADYGTQFELFFKGKMIYESILRPFIEFEIRDGSFLFDINKDGLYEMLLWLESNGSAGQVDGYLYSVDSSVVLINAFDKEYKSLPYFTDLDKDGIPELTFLDRSFSGFHVMYSEAPYPKLIWKWYKTNYRLANYKFSDYILKDIDSTNLAFYINGIRDWLRNGGPSKSDEYPPELWRIMLDYTYAGHIDMADNFFNLCWPDDVPGKQEMLEQFHFYYEKLPLYEQLINSNW